jgi:uncharacterized protein with von Willebrand factor type A (vWA) domain
VASANPDSVAAANALFHYAGDLQKALWLPALVCSCGSTVQRLQDLHAWEAAVQAGQLPSLQYDLGDPANCAAMRQAVADMGLCALAQGSVSMTKQVLRSMLWHLDRLIDRPVGDSRTVAIERMVQDFRDEWTLAREAWHEVLAVFKTLGELPNLRWDQLRGHLNRREWYEARRIGELLAHLKEITSFIDQMGRAQRSNDLPPSPQPQPSAHQPHQRAAVQITTQQVDQPGEVRGVKRSGEIARLLASEAVMIRHPLLQRPWRARFAEAQLLTYESEAVLTQWHVQPDDRR